MKEPILESKPIATGVIVGSGTISATHFLGYQWELWIVWMTVAISALILWAHFKAQVLRPLFARAAQLHDWYTKRRVAKVRKQRRVTDK